jgi:hypothetical protein
MKLSSEEERKLGHVIVSCHNCEGDTAVHASALGATNEDFPLDESWEDMTIPPGKYLPADNGFCLDLTGHYGGFTDDINGDLSNVVLCHDCALAVARVLPGVFKKHYGHHSMRNSELKTRNDESCCEFAWKSDANRGIYIGDGNGGWIKRTPL